MIIYKLQESGSRSMGFPTLEKYFQHQKDALIAFDAKIKEYRKSKELAKKKDLDGGKPIKIFENPESFQTKVLKEAWISVWDCCRTDCGEEWDIESVHLEIIEIEVA
ncbi:hypothetical protein [Cohnella sp. AR92]|uniref:hypothetical protein n=1 Tax=Cohnella sp. AR92 TaxID=648716 RepID=UPI000F8F331F|nr:hypothetical protein [Cohnella sp. AR92]RUS41939.1 hypothetical protein ELR57_27625 [Cohnella sp. AR92]